MRVYAAKATASLAEANDRLSRTRDWYEDYRARSARTE